MTEVNLVNFTPEVYTFETLRWPGGQLISNQIPLIFVGVSVCSAPGLYFSFLFLIKITVYYRFISLLTKRFTIEFCLDIR